MPYSPEVVDHGVIRAEELALTFITCNNQESGSCIFLGSIEGLGLVKSCPATHLLRGGMDVGVDAPTCPSPQAAVY